MIDPTLEKQVLSKDLWSVREAAQFLKLCEETVRSRVASGDLAAIRPARAIQIPAGALLSYLQKRAS